MDMLAWEGVVRENWKIGTDAWTAMCKIDTSWGPTLEFRELSSVLRGYLDRKDGCGMEGLKGGNICIHIANSVCCTTL